MTGDRAGGHDASPGGGRCGRQPDVTSTVLLLDVGSTTLKGVMVEAGTARQLAQAQEPMPPDVASHATRYELDAHAVRDVASRVVEELVEAAGTAPSHVLMSTQMHSCLLTDVADRPVSPVITWQDNRLAEPDATGRTALDRLLAAAAPTRWQRSGMAHRPGFGAGNLGEWLREHEQRTDGLRVHTLGSWIATAWGGPHATGLSNAAALGIVDLPTRTWSAGLIALHDLEGCDLPAILPQPGPSGIVRIDGSACTWLGDVGDHQAAVVGSGGLDDDELAVSLGTAGIAARVADQPSDDPRVDSRPHLDGRYLLAVSRQPGGALAAAFTQMLADVAGTLSGLDVSTETVWQRLSTLSSAPVADAGLTLSESAPGKHLLGLHGIRPATALDSMYAGFLTHYIEAYRGCIDVLFGTEAPRPRRIVLNGGVAQRNASFRTALARELDLEIRDVPTGDLALRGLLELVQHMTTQGAPS